MADVSPPSTPSRRHSEDEDEGKSTRRTKSVAFSNKNLAMVDSDGSNEQSPLLRGSFSDGGVSPLEIPSPGMDSDDWEAGKSQDSKSAWYMFLLTIGGFGLQMGWSVEMSNGSPYLLSLGLSKTMLALVWIAGPLSGVIAQPYIGIKSDRSRNPWGKRRPYFIGGGLATIISLMILAWTREIVGGILGIFGVEKDSRTMSVTVMVFAVFLIYVLDFAINVSK